MYSGLVKKSKMTRYRFGTKKTVEFVYMCLFFSSPPFFFLSTSFSVRLFFHILFYMLCMWICCSMSLGKMEKSIGVHFAHLDLQVMEHELLKWWMKKAFDLCSNSFVRIDCSGKQTNTSCVCVFLVPRFRSYEFFLRYIFFFISNCDKWNGWNQL